MVWKVKGRLSGFLHHGSTNSKMRLHQSAVFFKRDVMRHNLFTQKRCVVPAATCFGSFTCGHGGRSAAIGASARSYRWHGCGSCLHGVRPFGALALTPSWRPRPQLSLGLPAQQRPPYARPKPNQERATASLSLFGPADGVCRLWAPSPRPLAVDSRWYKSTTSLGGRFSNIRLFCVSFCWCT